MPRLDLGRALRVVHGATGVRLTVAGELAGGQVGAVRVRWPDGHVSVLTWLPGVAAVDFRERQEAAWRAARAAGVPAPELEALAEGDGVLVLVQQLLPGAPPEAVDVALLEQVLGVVDRCAGLLDEAVPPVRLWLTDSGPGFCLHEPLREHGARAAAVERWVRAVGRRLPDDVLPGSDVVHLDMQPANLLVEDGRLVGVVDWDGAGRGDRRLDLAALRFGLHAVPVVDDVVRRLDAVLDAVPAAVLEAAWAHMSLRMVDWAIRHFPPEQVGHWLSPAERRAG